MDRADFREFFAAVTGFEPFQWQADLLDHVLTEGRWPDRIVAPTGAGKTAAIHVHVFATALFAVDQARRLPRRLAMVVDRRVLVDDQYETACKLAEMLRSAEQPIVVKVAKHLRSMSPQSDPLVTGRLRGGSVPSLSWRDYPAACAVVCATPDMWGSRLLFRGYGTSGEAAPREAGLLAFDSVVMIDEAHLSRQLVTTARRVAYLATVADQPITGVPALQVVEVTATPAGIGSQRQVGVDDLGDARLAHRLTSPRPVTIVTIPATRQAGRIARAVTELREETGPGGTIGCFVNTVPMAMAVARELRRQSLTAVTVCGQIRPADLSRLRERYEGILDTRGNDKVDVLISTQSLEAGADLDFAALVTELASGPALAQRAGRVNRLGKRANAPITVLAPDTMADNIRSGPYGSKELADGLEWVKRFAGTDHGLSPWAVRQSPPPTSVPRRMLYQRPEVADAWHWARTSDNLAADPELDLWLSDSFDTETSLGIIIRDAVPTDDAEIQEFFRDLPPVTREIFPVPYRTAQSVLVELLGTGKRMVRLRGKDVEPLIYRTTSSADARPGDLVVIDSSARLVTPTQDGEFSPAVIVTSQASDGPDGIDDRVSADDVLHCGSEPRRGEVCLRLEWSPEHATVAGFDRKTARRILTELADGFRDQIESVRRKHLVALLKTIPSDEPHLAAVITLLGLRVKDSDVLLRETGNGGLRLVVIDRRRAIADEDLRQVYTPRDQSVYLQDHQNAVAERAAQLACELSLPDTLAASLRSAGLHHDDGKADLRFQTYRLGAIADSEPLAKSLPGTTIAEVQRAQGSGGLPSRWRHEQRSVVDSWQMVHADPLIDPELTARLIGTSHGHGRSGFPHVAAELAATKEHEDWLVLARDLFDEGGWDELIEQTHTQYGVWGCAYFEAVLRAADCQVSAEGQLCT
jgi:CRISPR-associated endonuclease/helicase Cas3